MDRINDRLKVGKPLRRQADTCADHDAVVFCRSQVAFYCLTSVSIWTDVADIGLPSSVGHLLQREADTGAYLLDTHTRSAKQD